ncbi:hypothetical protein FLK61_34260 [Paenalkalicoccus suaedae]|uniref:Uncharacterized protein n=1 Tax=Paenalkalicoccus suaedae TaxID=2592382 RepID=A0A859FGE5_9BACI|nr:hypothetical protein [Paenalkalicoccus suaedae]QKS71688.1 hypothetical protein FLK61_33965 [Paenalkalicoccus suaedae]QKS71742.1 hypothetical protein FLK61_34260 [Paenalkalicoccus suaedae]
MGDFSTGLAKVSSTYAPMIERQLTSNGVNMDDYSKSCVVNAIAAINNVLDTKGIKWNDADLDQNNLTDILLKVSALKLNASSDPREVYFQTRNVKVKVPGQKDAWKKQIEMGIEGDGNDAILSRFGRDVKQVAQVWLVREGDAFTYPTYTGLELSPPSWSPTGKGKVLRVVYPIIKTNDVVEYHIGEREDVVRNLIAHIKNNLMNETFGIAKSRFDASPKQKQEIDAKKNEIMNKVKEMSLDDALDSEDIQQYISPAWKDPQSRESMIIRKMRNNVVKKIPKDFATSFASIQYERATTDEYTKQVQEDISRNANQAFIDIPHSEVDDDPTPDPEPEVKPQADPPKQTETIDVDTGEIFDAPQKDSKHQDIYDDFDKAQNSDQPGLGF